MNRAPSRPGLRRWARRCLRLYPRAWRQRYEDEMLALLDRYPVTPWTLADLLAGAVDAHTQRRLLPREVFSMSHQIRTSANALLVAFALFFCAWIMVPFIRDSPREWAAATAGHSELNSALNVFEGVGVVAALALLAGGLPLAVAMVSQAVRGRRGDLLWRLATPVALFGALTAYSLVAQPAWWRRFGVTLPPSALWLKASFFLLAFLFIGVSAWALTSAASRSSLGDGLVRFVRLPGLLLGLALWAGCVALLTLTVLVFLEAPQLAGPVFLMPSFDAALLCACWIAGVAMRRLTRRPKTPETSGS